MCITLFTVLIEMNAHERVLLLIILLRIQTDRIKQTLAFLTLFNSLNRTHFVLHNVHLECV